MQAAHNGVQTKKLLVMDSSESLRHVVHTLIMANNQSRELGNEENRDSDEVKRWGRSS